MSDTASDRRIAQIFRDVARSQQITIRQQGDEVVFAPSGTEIRYPLNQAVSLTRTIARRR